MGKKRRARRKKPKAKARPRQVPVPEPMGSGTASRWRLWAVGLALIAALVVTIVAVPLLGNGGAGRENGAGPQTPPVYGYEIVRSYPHDRTAYTQGLVYHDGHLFEGTGQWGDSRIRKVKLETGADVKSTHLPPRYFGEGIAILGERLFQLTWEAGVAFVYNLQSFEKIREFRYSGEGWGLTHDGSRLVMSDGTATLRFVDPETFDVTRRLEVRDRGRPVRNLNELEYIDGEIYANVYQTDRIVRISPETGSVLGWIDLAGLLRPSEVTPESEVLNGIAHDREKGRLFVTGKCWPKLFEIKLVKR